MTPATKSSQVLRFAAPSCAALCATLALLALFSAPASARSVLRKKQLARSHFATAERMREALNGRPAGERSTREYQSVIDAYRRVYYTAPTSRKADASVVAVAELLAETGRNFDDSKSLRAAIGQYEFLRREYPGSKYRIEALFTIGQIYKEDLEDAAAAKPVFEDFLKRYPRHRLAADARDAIAEMAAARDLPASAKKQPAKDLRAAKPGKLPLVTGVRHWSTPDYTRIAIDLEQEVKYEAGRIANPDRIFFDLHDTRLASVLLGKTFDVQDGFLRKIRIAPYQLGLTRIVLEVDEVSDYSAFLLPNPYRLIVDIHGKQPSNLLKASDLAMPAPGPVRIESSKGDKPTAATPADESSAAPIPSARPSPKTLAARRELDRTSEAAANALDEGAKKNVAGSQKKSETEAADIANPDQSELKATAQPTSAPTFQAVAPRTEEKRGRKGKKATPEPVAREARPNTSGERSLIRALGLKIGRIVVDAGHGGHDTGTIGPSGLLEKELVLDVSQRLGKLLESRLGADVTYTRDDDTFIPLETRTAIANQNQADLFISIHANSSNDPAARGVETYYLNFTSSAEALEVAARENAVSEKSIYELQDLVKKIALKEKIEESREFAADVQRALHGGLAAKAPAIRDRGVKKAPFVVLIGANMPSVLAEISFLSNPRDERNLHTPEYRQKIAESLYRGISRYVGGLSGVKVAAKLGKQAGQ